MIIVSQDKTETTDNLNLRIEVIAEEQGEFPNIKRKLIGYCIVNKKYNTQLGVYKTKERAKEVLQEIVKTYVLTEQYKVEDERTRINLMMEGVFLYEMPKE